MPHPDPGRRTVACEACGGRFAVPVSTRREVVECPACGFTQIVRPPGRGPGGEGPGPAEGAAGAEGRGRGAVAESLVPISQIPPGRLARLRDLHEGFPTELTRRWADLLACPVRIRILDGRAQDLHGLLASYRLPNLRATIRESASGETFFWGWTSAGALAAARARAQAAFLRQAWDVGIAESFGAEGDVPLLHERALTDEQAGQMRAVLAPVLEALEAVWARQLDTILGLHELAWDKLLATQAALAGETMAALSLEVLVQDVRSEAYLAYPPRFIERFLPEKRRE